MDKYLDHVNIRPRSNIYKVFRHLPYKPWTALSEFVDNALESYRKNKNLLNYQNNYAYKLRVEIILNRESHTISIIDNAAGISQMDYSRAFRAAELPKDRDGLSNYGMGMKTASCWFSDHWSVVTKALYEYEEQTVIFDISKISKFGTEELEIKKRHLGKNEHFTRIILKDVKERMPKGRTVNKIKEHLASIYREFIRKEDIEIFFDNQQEPLRYEEIKILEAPKYDNFNGKTIKWKVPIEWNSIDTQKNKLKVSGFVALQEIMQAKNSGFALFNKGRVIKGSTSSSDGGGYKPPDIFGSVGSHLSKRLFGELHFEGFEVSHTKDDFSLDSKMQNFFEWLYEHLKNHEDIPILKQAKSFRINDYEDFKLNDHKVPNGKNESNTPEILKSKSDSNSVSDSKANNQSVNTRTKINQNSYKRNYEVNFNNTIWEVNTHGHCKNIQSDALFKILSDDTNSTSIQINNKVRISINMNHPFVKKFNNESHKSIEPILRMIVALTLSEISAKRMNSNLEGIRLGMSHILSNSLSN